MYSVACFVSPHGFGHAARASAVMEAMHGINPSIKFEIFTTIPEWFFLQSLSGTFTYHSLLTDVGMVQETPLCEDLTETVRKLDDFLPYDRAMIESLSKEINQIGCKLILCDIAPMGIVIAQTAQVHSVLIENFTWDWIYESYVSVDFPVNQHVEYLRKIFNSANYHIQAEPVCQYHNSDLITAPISRKVGVPLQEMRRRLGIPDGVKVMLITMGGVPEEFKFLKQLKDQDNIYFIIPGGSKFMQIIDNLVLLPHHSDFFHPDILNACDAVVGKLGYSTLAEIYHAGVPYGYIPRSSFKESDVLEVFVKEQMSGIAIPETAFQDGSWISFIPEILLLPRIKRNGSNGAVEAAEFVSKVLNIIF